MNGYRGTPGGSVSVIVFHCLDDLVPLIVKPVDQVSAVDVPAPPVSGPHLAAKPLTMPTIRMDFATQAVGARSLPGLGAGGCRATTIAAVDFSTYGAAACYRLQRKPGLGLKGQ